MKCLKALLVGQVAMPQGITAAARPNDSIGIMLCIFFRWIQNRPGMKFTGWILWNFYTLLKKLIIFLTILKENHHGNIILSMCKIGEFISTRFTASIKWDRPSWLHIIAKMFISIQRVKELLIMRKVNLS